MSNISSVWTKTLSEFSMESGSVAFTIDSLQQAGGLERVLTTRCNHLASDPNFKVTIVTLDGPGSKSYFRLDPTVRHIALDVKINRHRSLYSIENLRHALRYAGQLKRLLAEINPDLIVNCDHSYSTYILPFVKGRARLLCEHHTPYARIHRPDWRWAVREKFRRSFEARCDGLLFLNASEAELGGFENPIILPNPVVDRLFEAPVLRDKTILSAGRMADEKGFDRLIDIWGAIAGRHPDWRLRIFGDGCERYRASLIEQATQLGVADRIDILPATDNLAGEMRQASIYAMASRSEAFPMVLLEAMREGLPIVAYDCPTGPRAILSDGQTGLLVEDGKSDIFASALTNLMGDAVLRSRLAAAAGEEVRRYSVSAIGSQWRKWVLEARDSRPFSVPSFDEKSRNLELAPQ